MIQRRAVRLAIYGLSLARPFANSMSMNLRHTAALTLVVWYLILPPISNGTPETAAPLSRWEIQFKFDTAVKCQSTRDEVAKDTLADLQNPEARDLQGQLLMPAQKDLLLRWSKQDMSRAMIRA